MGCQPALDGAPHLSAVCLSFCLPEISVGKPSIVGALEVPGSSVNSNRVTIYSLATEGQSRAGLRPACRDVLTEKSEEFGTQVLLTAAHGPVRADRVVPPALEETVRR